MKKSVFIFYLCFVLMKNQEKAEIMKRNKPWPTNLTIKKKIREIKGRQAWPVMNSLIKLNLDNNFLGESLVGGRYGYTYLN